MVIGIPRALLYFKYAPLWEGYFKSLGIEYILSPPTDRDIVSRGTSLAVDESCLSFKIYLGHVDWLLDKCDAVLIPRISGFGRAGTVCTRFQAIYDVVTNTFRSNPKSFINYNVDLNAMENEMGAFIKLGNALGKSRSRSILAYLTAKQAEKAANLEAAAREKRSLREDRIKVMLVSHCYNTYDGCTGGQVGGMLRAMDAVPVLASALSTREAVSGSAKLSDTVPWLFSKELLGAVALYEKKVDGIILMSTFPCGPDSLVNELIIRKVKDKPVLTLILDGQEATAGLETRLESFIDIIRFKKEETKWTA